MVEPISIGHFGAEHTKEYIHGMYGMGNPHQPLGPIVDFTKSRSPINLHPLSKTSEFMHLNIIWDSPISIPEGGRWLSGYELHRLILGHIRSGRRILQHRKMPFRRGLGC